MKARAAIVLGLLSSVLWFGGCSKAPATFTPAITSPVPADKVLADAITWAAADPAHRFVSTVADTHSMEPFFTNHSVVLCLRYQGQPIPNGTVAIYRFSDAFPRVMHVISDQTADSVYMSGANNHDSDGWYPKKSIEGFAVGQLYSP